MEDYNSVRGKGLVIAVQCYLCEGWFDPYWIELGACINCLEEMVELEDRPALDTK